jgi:TonB family protein
VAGSVSVDFTIDETGRVTQAAIGNSGLGRPDIEGCIVSAMRRLKFPEASAATRSSYPFVFNADK